MWKKKFVTEIVVILEGMLVARRGVLFLSSNMYGVQKASEYVSKLGWKWWPFSTASLGSASGKSCTKKCWRTMARQQHSGHAYGMADISREDHNKFQEQQFTEDVIPLKNSITPKVNAKLARIAEVVPNLGPESRVLDVGAGTGALIPHLQNCGVQDILAVDVCPAMLQTLREDLNVHDPPTLGNEPAVRTWEGDVDDIPNYQGPFDASFFNAVYGNLYSPKESLTKIALMTRPGGYIVISHPLGRHWHEKYASEHSKLVPHPLPDLEEYEELLMDLPLTLLSLEDEDDFYCALLQVPSNLQSTFSPIYLSGTVVNGFGRGSKQLGVPTANIPPESLGEMKEKIPAGVYFGWARLMELPEASPRKDGNIHKMVMNIGKRPTFEDKDPETTVELHIMHDFAEDFYGKELRAVVTGFIRPEIKFNSLQDLLTRINADIGTAQSQLDSEQHKSYSLDTFIAV